MYTMDANFARNDERTGDKTQALVDTESVPQVCGLDCESPLRTYSSEPLTQRVLSKVRHLSYRPMKPTMV